MARRQEIMSKRGDGAGGKHERVTTGGAAALGNYREAGTTESRNELPSTVFYVRRMFHYSCSRSFFSALTSTYLTCFMTLSLQLIIVQKYSNSLRRIIRIHPIINMAYSII